MHLPKYLLSSQYHQIAAIVHQYQQSQSVDRRSLKIQVSDNLNAVQVLKFAHHQLQVQSHHHLNQQNILKLGEF